MTTDPLKLDEKFTSSSGLPMAEYVPMDYPRSDVLYARVAERRALANPHGNTDLVALPPVEGAYLAGGYPSDVLYNRGFGETKDIDVFFKSKEAFIEMYEELLTIGFVPDEQGLTFADHKHLVWTKEFEALPYIQMHPPYDLHTAFGGRCVQLVKIRWYEDAEHVIDSFDFTVVQVAVDLATHEFVFNPAGALDYMQRLLVQHRVESHARVMMRLEKYRSKGFWPGPEFVIPPETKVEVTP